MQNGVKIKYMVGGIVGMLLLVGCAIFILSRVVEQHLRKQLSNISPAVRLKFQAVHVNLFSSSVSFDSVTASYTPYNSSPHYRHEVQISNVSLQGIRFLKYLFNRQLQARSLLFTNGNIVFDKFLLDKRDSAQTDKFQKVQVPFQLISIGNIELKGITFLLHSNKANTLIAMGDLAVNQVQLNLRDSAFDFETLDCTLSRITVANPIA
ncbi:MAG TPA: hypothetical protein VLC28_03685, partial [Flavitalea sp.]|nr:hypothetical protein [Flavitalea sp.]